jgi:hypothetical protein
LVAFGVAVNHFDGTGRFVRQMSAYCFRHGDRSMLSTGASNGDRQVTTSLAFEAGQAEVQKPIDDLDIGRPLFVIENVRPDGLVVSRHVS